MQSQSVSHTSRAHIYSPTCGISISHFSDRWAVAGLEFTLRQRGKGNLST